jgi:hypothetical protein
MGGKRITSRITSRPSRKEDQMKKLLTEMQVVGPWDAMKAHIEPVTPKPAARVGASLQPSQQVANSPGAAVIFAERSGHGRCTD